MQIPSSKIYTFERRSSAHDDVGCAAPSTPSRATAVSVESQRLNPQLSNLSPIKINLHCHLLFISKAKCNTSTKIISVIFQKLNLPIKYYQVGLIRTSSLLEDYNTTCTVNVQYIGSCK